jgi:hypothetical protein
MVASALLVFVFWIAAALLAGLAHTELDPLSPLFGALVTVVSLVGVAWGYMRACHHSGVSHALGAGIAWLVLAIATELAITTRLGHGWYSLIGSPERPLLRTIFLFVWLFAPALFATEDARV